MVVQQGIELNESIVPLSSSIGAEVRGFQLSGRLNDADLQRIAALLLRHKVLFFPDQNLSLEDHRSFAALWGEMEIHPYIDKVDDYPEIVKINDIADRWHTDVTFAEQPPVMSILHMVAGPATGGDTMWSNQAAAYAALSDPIRDLLDGLTAIHSARAFGRPERTCVHPAVRVHPETGQRCLYVNSLWTERFVELSTEESRLLLSYLFDFSVRPEFSVRFRWKPRTVAMWDNRCTQHYVVNDVAPDENRLLHRVTILGDWIDDVEPRWRAAQPTSADRYAL